MAIKNIAQVDIQRVRGETDDIVVTVQRPDKTVFDFTGYTAAYMAVNPDKDPEDTSGQLFRLSGVFDIPNGTITFPVTEEQADNPSGIYYQNLLVIDSNSKVKAIAEGKYKILPSVTRA